MAERLQIEVQSRSLETGTANESKFSGLIDPPRVKKKTHAAHPKGQSIPQGLDDRQFPVKRRHFGCLNLGGNIPVRTCLERHQQLPHGTTNRIPLEKVFGLQKRRNL